MEKKAFKSLAPSITSFVQAGFESSQSQLACHEWAGRFSKGPGGRKGRLIRFGLGSLRFAFPPTPPPAPSPIIGSVAIQSWVGSIVVVSQRGATVPAGCGDEHLHFATRPWPHWPVIGCLLTFFVLFPRRGLGDDEGINAHFSTRFHPSIHLSNRATADVITSLD